MNVLELYEELQKQVREGNSYQEVVKYDEEGNLAPVIFVEETESGLVLGG